MYKFVFKYLAIVLTVWCFACCSKAPEIPKPSTYLRIDVEKPHYVMFSDNRIPFTFEYPDYAQIEFLDSKSKDIKWFNINFTKYNLVANVSYIPLNTKTALSASVKDCYTFLKKHERLSSGIVSQAYQNNTKHVFGNTFEIKGRDVVSPYQFYLTDSNHHFIRVALNNNIVPNNDSIAPVIKQIKLDLKNMINTLSWK